MHELSIAQSLIELVLMQLAAYGLEDCAPGLVVAVRVKVGVLGSIIPSALKSAFCVAIQDSPLAGTRLEIEILQAVVWCSNCEREQFLSDLGWRRCPACNRPTPELRNGLELELTSVVLKEEVHAAHS